jgi:hypothetical protein
MVGTLFSVAVKLMFFGDAGIPLSGLRFMRVMRGMVGKPAGHRIKSAAPALCAR